jgi:23S rRNA pseudouridine2457 synthase
VHCTHRFAQGNVRRMTAEVSSVAHKPITIPRRESLPLILLNKPFRVLSQFSDGDGRPTLANYVSDKDVYPAGRLDFDSEGLLLLTDDGRLQARISQPKAKVTKTYWAQVEGQVSDAKLAQLVAGVTLKDGIARASFARLIEPQGELWDRDPPIRHRASIPDAWIEIGIGEGRNRQVRRMTAAVGLPTLRLIRASIGPWALDGLRPGESRSLDNDAAWRQLSRP